MVGAMSIPLLLLILGGNIYVDLKISKSFFSNYFSFRSSKKFYLPFGCNINPLSVEIT